MKRWMPPNFLNTSGPGRSIKWYVLARMTRAPAAFNVSTVCPFTVAWVPTGQKTGVLTSPCSVRNVAARACDSLDASRVKFNRVVAGREFDRPGIGELKQFVVICVGIARALSRRVLSYSVLQPNGTLHAFN